MYNRFFIQKVILIMVMLCLGHVGNSQVAWPIQTGMEPDLSLSGTITGNQFPTNGSSQTLVLHISEVGGHLAVGDTLRITKMRDFNYAFNIADFGVLAGGNFYILDNYRWKVVSNHPSYYYLILTGPNNAQGAILPNQQLHVSLVITRNSPNVSDFALTTRLRRADGELNLTNNHFSLLLAAR